MGIRLRKLSRCIVIQILLCCIAFSFLGCEYDPETMIPMSPSEICKYMNDNFEGRFEIERDKIVDNEEETSNLVYMKCSKLPGKTVITKHGYERSVFGWGKVFKTNYYSLYYRDDVERTYNEFMENWFGAFETKYVFLDDYYLYDIAHFTTFSDFLKSRPNIDYTVVLNTNDAKIHEYALIKAKAVSFDIKTNRDYPLWINLYLWDADNFDALTEDDIRAFGNDTDSSYEDDFYYSEEALENYSW